MRARMTRAEQETHFRWDNEGRTLEAWTADSWVAEKWRRAGYDVKVLGKTSDGQERTWEVVLPMEGGHRRPWTRLFLLAVPRFRVEGQDEDTDSISGHPGETTIQDDNMEGVDPDDQAED